MVALQRLPGRTASAERGGKDGGRARAYRRRMRLIVADTAGTGLLWDRYGLAHALDPDTWRETDLRDAIVTGDGQHAWVVYRDDGHIVTVPPNTTYPVEVKNDDVVDVSSAWDDEAAHLAAALERTPANEDEVFRVLEKVQGWADGIRALTEAYTRRTGSDLEAALRAKLTGDELSRAILCIW